MLKIIAGLPFMGGLCAQRIGFGRRRRPPPASVPATRIGLRTKAGLSSAAKSAGRLIKVRSPLAACVGAPSDAACAQVVKELKNPYYLGDEVGLTQSLGWVGAWTSQPSVYAVAAKTTADVVAAVNFARENNLRLVVKGGGHSYQGTSNAADSLLIWTRHMNARRRSTTPSSAPGCEGRAEPQPAVSVEAGRDLGACL